GAVSRPLPLERGNGPNRPRLLSPSRRSAEQLRGDLRDGPGAGSHPPGSLVPGRPPLLASSSPLARRAASWARRLTQPSSCGSHYSHGRSCPSIGPLLRREELRVEELGQGLQAVDQPGAGDGQPVGLHLVDPPILHVLTLSQCAPVQP